MTIQRQLISEFFYVYETNRYSCPDFAFERYFSFFSSDDIYDIVFTIIKNNHLNDPVTFADSLNWIAKNIQIPDSLFHKLLQIDEIYQSNFFAKIIRYNQMSHTCFHHIIRNDEFFNGCHFSLSGNIHCPKSILFKIIEIYDNQKDETIYKFLNSIIQSPQLSDEEAFSIIEKYPKIMYYPSLFKREWQTEFLWNFELLLPKRHWMTDSLKSQKNYKNVASAILKKFNQP